MSRDIAISSREISAQIVQDEVLVAYIGVPGPPGPPGENIVEYRDSLGTYEGVWQAGTQYQTGSIVTYRQNETAGWGTYWCKSGPTTEPPTNASVWDVLASPGQPGAPGDSVPEVKSWLYPFAFRHGAEMTWTAGTTYRGPGSLEDTDNEQLTRQGLAHVVRYNGALWVCRFTHTANNNNRPGRVYGGVTYWGKLAEDVKLTASAESIAWNSPASVTITGDHPDRQLHFKIPRGKDGESYKPSDFPYSQEQLKGQDGADALAWIAFQFDTDTQHRFIVPQACTLKLGQTVKSTGASLHTVSKRTGTTTTTPPQTADVPLAAGDTVIVTVSGLGANESYLVTLVVGPA